MKKLTIQQVLHLHQKMAKATGGEDGVRSLELLESAICNAFATFDGNDLHENIEDKASSICFSVINNHPFIDGNKRMGIYIMLVILELNEIKISYTQNELIILGLTAAKGELKQQDIYIWIENHKT